MKLRILHPASLLVVFYLTAFSVAQVPQTPKPPVREGFTHNGLTAPTSPAPESPARDGITRSDVTRDGSGQPWKPLGPDGGDVRSFAYDPASPDRIFLGTSSGTLYLSSDGGVTWGRFAHLGHSDEMVLDNIVIDPGNSRLMYVAAWSIESPGEGDLFRSKDGGKNWEISPDMHGKSIRALAIAASDSKVLVAGALDGVFRTLNSGDKWERISPENHAELRNVESVAIDPVNPDIIYAGTWHLPWKTEDGGKHWHSIKKGIIDDSDVFSIIIDPVNPAVVYASACSGIYKSETAGDLFHKIQGIPFSARRTRVLEMDPRNHNVVYAGTTEGLWKTSDAGATWKRMTAANIIVNDVLVDPRNTARLLLATDRSGVLASDDGAASFTTSNRGFAHRQVAALLVDRNDSSTFYAGVLNGKEFGGVFLSRDAGLNWKQVSDGLNGRDVFVLRQADDGLVIAGTNRGIFQFDSATGRWQPLNVLQSELRTRNAARSMTKELDARVNALDLGPQSWYAATAIGLLASNDHGHTWRRCAKAAQDLKSVSALDRMVVAAGHHTLLVSVNGGESWLMPFISSSISTMSAIKLDRDGAIWVGAREGLFKSTDAGESWHYVVTLPLADIVSLEYDGETRHFLATGAASTSVFESFDNGRTWHRTDSGWSIHQLHSAGGRLIATTPFDGVVIQPPASTLLQEISRGGGNR